MCFIASGVGDKVSLAGADIAAVQFHPFLWVASIPKIGSTMTVPGMAKGRASRELPSAASLGQ